MNIYSQLGRPDGSLHANMRIVAFGTRFQRAMIRRHCPQRVPQLSLIARLSAHLYNSKGCILPSSCGADEFNAGANRRATSPQRKFECGLSICNLQFAIRIVHHLILRGVRIGEASHPGPRLRRRGPRSLESRAARRNREGPASVIQERQVENCENGLLMLHLNLRG